MGSPGDSHWAFVVAGHNCLAAAADQKEASVRYWGKADWSVPSGPLASADHSEVVELLVTAARWNTPDRQAVATT